jgi:hypothetical protein
MLTTSFDVRRVEFVQIALAVEAAKETRSNDATTTRCVYRRARMTNDLPRTNMSITSRVSEQSDGSEERHEGRQRPGKNCAIDQGSSARARIEFRKRSVVGSAYLLPTRKCVCPSAEQRWSRRLRGCARPSDGADASERCPCCCFCCRVARASACRCACRPCGDGRPADARTEERRGERTTDQQATGERRGQTISTGTERTGRPRVRSQCVRLRSCSFLVVLAPTCRLRHSWPTRLVLQRGPEEEEAGQTRTDTEAQLCACSVTHLRVRVCAPLRSCVTRLFRVLLPSVL